ncbi:hypothetical protein GMOD_00008861 [Pyrenophora seminiperda CCB06]|uniref:DNA replication factor Cdt1 C-terminal domain-containing protein n=1 Tax=Pyrenophora seminiperda CCB06 TaxID=1302712 RepID=A0A3M7M5Z6_9PLEO|nr:hypothetical protein GMOD_00008861 [Pyrenophora seminiperda CCB06]
MSRRLATFGGLTAVGGVTYYLYSAGGDPKLAEKKAEHDAATAARKLRGDYPGQDKELKKAGEEGYEAVRARAEQYADQAKAEAKKAEQKLDAYSQNARKQYEDAKLIAEKEFHAAGKQVNAAANKFDAVVEDKAAKTSSWFGGWFGGNCSQTHHSPYIKHNPRHIIHRHWYRYLISVSIPLFLSTMSPIAPGQLPAELVNLLALHSSFLTALSLHYAHNGTSTPADLRDLVASTTLVWRQRKVTNEDVRLLIGILDHGPSGHNNPYYLSDYGRGKICIEIKDDSSMMGETTHMNEEGMQDMFKEGLDTLEFKESVQQGRAQKKTRAASGKENEPASITAAVQPAQAKITEFAAVRKTNLLDRILAKQEAAKAGPAAPSPAELQRKAALQRTPEVLGVLSLLCANRPGARVSFSTTTLLQALQGSIRSPISKDEAMKCVEVLANEVAPGYISVVSMGSISSVVINQMMRPTDIKNRLVALGA